MPKVRVSRITNVVKTRQVAVQLLDGSTVYLQPGKSLEDVEVINLHKIKDSVRVDDAEITEVGVADLTEVNPDRVAEGRIDLTEVKPPKHKRGTRLTE